MEIGEAFIEHGAIIIFSLACKILFFYFMSQYLHWNSFKALFTLL